MSVVAPIPQGPGVQPPFPAPPSEGRGTRLGWGLGIAGAALVLFCGGGLTVLLGFGVAQVAAVNEQSKVVMSEYLGAIRDGKYDRAYELVCDSEQKETSKESFATQEKARGELEDFEVGEFNFETGELPVTERYRNRTPDQVIYYFENDPKTAQLEICGRSN